MDVAHGFFAREEMFQRAALLSKRQRGTLGQIAIPAKSYRGDDGDDDCFSFYIVNSGCWYLQAELTV
jgi:hypothetical protein